ncbi:unnamed protein product [Urochloa humidicola]
MGRGGSRPGGVARRQRAVLVAAVALCTLLAQPEPSRAFLFFFGGGDREEKVPMTVVSSDYAPRPAPLPLAPSPSPAPAPARGGDDDGTPRLPSERQGPGDHGAAGAPAGPATSADFISSSPAVPLPAGVTDSATVMPMPTPGHQQQQQQRRVASCSASHF